MHSTRMLSIVLGLALAAAPVDALAARGAFRHAADHATEDAAEQAAIITGAVLGGLTLIGLTTWYFVRRARRGDQHAGARAVEAAELARLQVRQCAEANGEPALACW